MKLQAEWLCFCHFSGLCHKFDETGGGVSLSFDILAFAIELCFDFVSLAVFGYRHRKCQIFDALCLFWLSADFGFLLDMCLYRSFVDAFD